MNITTNELMLLNKIRFGEAENPKPTVEEPVAEEQSPEKGMNALMFKGMQNLMSNPGLAQQTGAMNSTNVAFQGKFAQKAMIGTLALSSLLAASTFQSCRPYDSPISVSQSVEVKLDMQVITAMLAELQAMRQDMKDRDAAQEARFARLYALLVDMSETLANLEDGQNAKNALLTQIWANQNTYISLLQDEKTSREEAMKLFLQFYEDYKNDKITLSQFLQAIQDHVANIDANVADLLASFKHYVNNQNKFQVLAILYAQQIAYNTQATAHNTASTDKKMDKLIAAADSAMTYMGGTAAKLEDIEEAIINADNNNQAGQQKLAQEIQKAKDALMALGYQKMFLDSMNDSQIIALLKEQNALLRQTQQDLKDLKNKFTQGMIDAQKYALEVTKLLRDIKKDMGVLTVAVVDLTKSVKQSEANTNKLLTQIRNSGYHRNYLIEQLLNAHEAEAADRGALKTAFEELLNVVKNIDGTSTSIYNALLERGLSKQEIEEFFKILNMHQEERNNNLIDAETANKDEIIAAINDFKADQLAKDDAMIKVQNLILDKLTEIAGNIDNNQGNTVDLTKLEKGLADILAAIKALPQTNPNYMDILNKIYNKIGDIKCTCDCQADASNHEGILQDINDILG